MGAHSTLDEAIELSQLTAGRWVGVPSRPNRNCSGESDGDSKALLERVRGNGHRPTTEIGAAAVTAHSNRL